MCSVCIQSINFHFSLFSVVYVFIMEDFRDLPRPAPAVCVSLHMRRRFLLLEGYNNNQRTSSPKKTRSNIKYYRRLLKGSTKFSGKLKEDVLSIGKTGQNNQENTNV